MENLELLDEATILKTAVEHLRAAVKELYKIEQLTLVPVAKNIPFFWDIEVIESEAHHLERRRCAMLGEAHGSRERSNQAK
ncbi:MAG TPA: hypothetical protein VEB88_04185 [Candidatus Acidoferrales bacterium]|jgi:predicted transcriptional regulator|nr:hypothetical protein [Candidatus Acidoferrales bacterium]